MRESRHDGMTLQSRLQGAQQMQALLAQGRHVAANAAKGAGAGLTAKGAGDFLLHFDHAHIALGLIVGPSRQLHRLHL